jgi:hypothetical protein
VEVSSGGSEPAIFVVSYDIYEIYVESLPSARLRSTLTLRLVAASARSFSFSFTAFSRRLFRAAPRAFFAALPPSCSPSDSIAEEPASECAEDMAELAVRWRLRSDLTLLQLAGAHSTDHFRTTYSSLSSRARFPLRLPPSTTLPSVLLSSRTLRRTSSSSYAARLFIVERRFVNASASACACFPLSFGTLASVSFATEVLRWVVLG